MIEQDKFTLIVDQINTDYKRIHKLKPAITTDNFDEVIKCYEIDPLDEPDTDSVIVKCQGERFMSLGNISAIVGLSKSGKTSVIKMIAGAVLTNGNTLEQSVNDKLSVCIPGNKLGVVRLDTEQSSNDIKLNNVQTIKLVGREAIKGLRCFEFGMSSAYLDSMLESIEMIIERHANDCKLFIIDQLADLVPSVNDMEACRDLIANLMYLAKIYDVHILNVIHTNKSGLSAIGSLGSFVEKKAETMLMIIKDKENQTSVVDPIITRGAPFEKFQLGWKSGGVPYISDAPVISKKAAFGPASYTRDKHIQLLKSEFEYNVDYKPSDIKVKIKNALQRMGARSSGDGVSRQFYQHYRDNGYITTQDEKVNRYTTFKIDVFLDSQVVELGSQPLEHVNEGGLVVK